MTAMKKLLVALLLISGLTGLPALQAAEERRSSPPKETRKVPAMREITYKEISRAQLLIEGETDEEDETVVIKEKDPQAAVDLLLRLKDRRGINGYEIGQIWNMLAFAYYSLEDIANTIKSYEEVLKQGDDITIALEQSSLRALFQLYYQQENYKKSLEYIDRWEQVASAPDPVVIYLRATAHYQLEEWRPALTAAIETVDLARSMEREVKENWVYLQVILYSELDDIDNVIRVLEEMVLTWPKKNYWMHLASMYSEKGWDDKSLSAFYAVYYQELFSRESEYVMLAQRLLNAEVPFEAAKVLREGLDRDFVEKNERNIRLLGQAYTMAQESDLAIDAWREASNYAEDGMIYFRLAQALASSDRHEEAVGAFDKALELGGLRSETEVNFWMGISLMQLERWEPAILQFTNAGRDESRKDTVDQYIRYIRGERNRQRQLAELGAE